jgi:Protein of unknown function (DUF2958)
MADKKSAFSSYAGLQFSPQRLFAQFDPVLPSNCAIRRYSILKLRWNSQFDSVDTFFGAVSGIEFELGYFSLSELEQTTGPLGLHIERDLYFKPTPLSEIRKQYDRH